MAHLKLLEVITRTIHFFPGAKHCKNIYLAYASRWLLSEYAWFVGF